MNRRIISVLGLIGIIVGLINGGFHFQSANGNLSISLPLLVLASWPLFLVATFSTQIGKFPVGNKLAPWWKKSVSFIYDFILLFNLLFIPIALMALINANGAFPPPWSFEGINPNSSYSFTLIYVLFFALFWFILGIALHPNVKTPGMILTGIDLRVEKNTSFGHIAFLGVFGYYGVFIPLFNMFTMGLKINGTQHGT